MKVIEHIVPYTYGETIRIKPIFDVHEGDALCDIKALKRWLAEDDKSYFVFGGDLFDCTWPGHRFYQKMLDKSGREAVIDAQVESMAETLEPYKSRIIQIGEGNHERRVAQITNPGHRLADMLGVPYTGMFWTVILRLRQRTKKDYIERTKTVKILGHHGWGSGTRTDGGSLTKYAKHARVWNADFCLYGHDHHLVARKIPRMDWVGTTVVHKPKFVVLCGAWTKTFTGTEDAGYAEAKGFDPVEIGGPVLNIKPHGTSGLVYWVDT